MKKFDFKGRSLGSALFYIMRPKKKMVANIEIGQSKTNAKVILISNSLLNPIPIWSMFHDEILIDKLTPIIFHILLNYLS